MKRNLLIYIFWIFPFIIAAQNLNSNTTGSFIYIPQAPLNTKNIKVFYHIPDGDITTMPIVFSFHGANRNADDYRDYWITMANAHSFMVFAPEFSSSDFPGGDAYNLANIFDDGDNPSTATFNSKNEWTFSVIDPLFEYIKNDISGTQEKYNAWGHSAGSQFLQRFILYLPESKLDLAVCSNAGWYTVPENTINFPYGIKNGQLPNTDLQKAFSKKVVVHLGTNDTDPNSAGLRHNTVVDNQQGLYRLVRGNYFFEASKTTALNLNTAFNWEKIEVANVGHEAQKMANAALQYIITSSLSIKNNFNRENIVIFPNPASEILYVESNKKPAILTVYSLQGKLLKQTTNTNEISLIGFSAGIYFLHVNNQFIKFIIQ